MQITLNIDESVAERLHAEAKRRGTTASALAETGIRRVLAETPAESKTRQTHDTLPELPKLPPGPMLVDIANKEELYRVMYTPQEEPAPETAEELMKRLPKWRSGGELVDINNKEELYRVMDEDDGIRY
jgi:hypothetical protein